MPDRHKPIPILEKQTTSTNVLRGRDVIATLSGRNLDPLLIDCLAKLAEINHTNMKAIAEIATMQNQMIDIVQKFADISQNMKDKMAQIERGTNAELAGDEGAADTKH